MSTDCPPPPLPADLPEVLRRIRTTARPSRVILFGSAARGDARPDSDLDLLVIVPAGTHRRHTAQSIYRSLLGIETPVDVVVMTEQDVERYAHTEGLVIAHALAEGRLLYAA
ncbi:MAG: nucleotidyltransferase domain-containing protein [Candidatus Latescibacterota bacterium]